MDSLYIAIEIDKYLRNPLHTNPLTKIVLSSAYDDFIPESLKKFEVVKDTIKPVSEADGMFEFIVKGEIRFTEKASGVSKSIEASLHGYAHLESSVGREYVDFVEIDSLPSTQEILKK